MAQKYELTPNSIPHLEWMMNTSLKASIMLFSREANRSRRVELIRPVIDPHDPLHRLRPELRRVELQSHSRSWGNLAV